MNLHDILDKKLLIVSGKGGVGKTSVAASLGLLAAKAGKKTLIAEINAAERIAEIFDIKPIGYHETPLSLNLFAINIDPKTAFEEYIVEQIHSKKIFNLVFENRFVRSFLDATPGLNELLEIGKIWSLSDRENKPEDKNTVYDLIIVDAPSTGHGLAFLEVPRIVADAVRVGPLKTKSELILKLIQDPQKTLLLLVSLAEEMPVNETLEMLEKARSAAKIATGPVFVNSLFPKFLTDKENKEVDHFFKVNKDNDALEKLYPVIHLFQKRVELQHFYFNKLKTNIKNTPLIGLPFIFKENFGLEAIQELAEALENNFSERDKNYPKEF